jgi:hypothetical protein
VLMRALLLKKNLIVRDRFHKLVVLLVNSSGTFLVAYRDCSPSQARLFQDAFSGYSPQEGYVAFISLLNIGTIV